MDNHRRIAQAKKKNPHKTKNLKANNFLTNLIGLGVLWAKTAAKEVGKHL